MARASKILVVDDEEICLTIAAKLIETLGLDVILAHDGIEAVQLYEENKDDIACVMLDIHMPRMNGIEAFKRLKSINDDVHVVITSGYVNATNRRLLDPINPLGYIKKPVSLDNIIHYLNRYTSGNNSPYIGNDNH